MALWNRKGKGKTKQIVEIYEVGVGYNPNKIGVMDSDGLLHTVDIKELKILEK